MSQNGTPNGKMQQREYAQKALEMCREMPLLRSVLGIDDKRCPIQTEHIKTGITNNLVRVYRMDNKEIGVLVKYNGPHTEIMINRESEMMLVAYLASFGGAKHTLTTFPGGRVEEWVEGTPVNIEICFKEQVQISIARKLADLHMAIFGLDLDHYSATLRRHAHQAKSGRWMRALRTDCHLSGEPVQYEIEGSSVKRLRAMNATYMENFYDFSIWRPICAFILIIKDAMENPDLLDINERRIQLFNIKRIAEISVDAHSLTADVNSPIVLGHGDLLCDNILTTPHGTMFLDFEYAGSMERGHDLANHFCEYTGFKCEWEKYFPAHETRYRFLQAYVQAIRDILPRIKVDSIKDEQLINTYKRLETESNVEMSTAIKWLEAEMAPFYVTSHLYWGCWALIQGVHSNKSFDYFAYAFQRLLACNHKVFNPIWKKQPMA